MKGNKPMRLALILSLLSFGGICVLYPRAPGLVPIHWNAQGYVDRFGERYWLLLFGLFPLAVWALFSLLPRLDPRGKNYQKHRGAYGIIGLTLTVLTTALSWLLALAAIGVDVPMGSAVSAGIGLFMVVLGNWIPQLRPNYFMGIRTPWTLASKTVWRKTHRLGGPVFITCGIAIAGTAFLPGSGIKYAVTGILVPVVIVGIFVYSYIIYKKEGREKETDAQDS